MLYNESTVGKPASKNERRKIMEERKVNMPLIGEQAPEFTAMTTEGVINFPADYKGKWAILFSHPADFTPVCTTEFMTFASLQDEFKALNCELIGLSIDSIHSHIAWLKKIEEFQWKDIKNVKVKFPVIEDVSMNVASKYGMVHDKGGTSAVRAVFYVDPKGIIRTILYYPASCGRNFNELKRILIALQKSDKDGVATPADWHPGQDTIIPPPNTVPGANERLAKEGDNCLDWFLCFRKEK